MAYKQSPINFGVGTGGSSPLRSTAGQGYLDNLQKHKEASQNPATGGMGGVHAEEQQIQQDMSDVDVSPKKEVNDHREFNFSQSLSEFQGGDLTNRQKRLIAKGKTEKAKNIGSRRRNRVLKRGGDVSSSMRKGSYKGEYVPTRRIQSESGTERLNEGGHAYNFEEANKAKGASGGFFGRLFGGRG
jgi:hypothetical protein